MPRYVWCTFPAMHWGLLRYKASLGNPSSTHLQLPQCMVRPYHLSNFPTVLEFTEFQRRLFGVSWFLPRIPQWFTCTTDCKHSATNHTVADRQHSLVYIPYNVLTGFLCIVASIHYSTVTMSNMASQITSISTVCSNVCSGAHETKH